MNRNHPSSLVNSPEFLEVVMPLFEKSFIVSNRKNAINLIQVVMNIVARCSQSPKMRNCTYYEIYSALVTWY